MKPKARDDNLFVQQLGDELILYDMERGKYHQLNGTAALVWKSCDGRRTLTDLTALVRAQRSPEADEEVVFHALQLLSGARLLSGSISERPVTHDRRAFLRKLAAGGTTVALATVCSLAGMAKQVWNQCPGFSGSGREVRWERVPWKAVPRRSRPTHRFIGAQSLAEPSGGVPETVRRQVGFYPVRGDARTSRLRRLSGRRTHRNVRPAAS
jgi:Coenzyme PQQ synthesis protein D (PqqD)